MSTFHPLTPPILAPDPPYSKYPLVCYNNFPAQGRFFCSQIILKRPKMRYSAPQHRFGGRQLFKNTPLLITIWKEGVFWKRIQLISILEIGRSSRLRPLFADVNGMPLEKNPVIWSPKFNNRWTFKYLENFLKIRLRRAKTSFHF